MYVRVCIAPTISLPWMWSCQWRPPRSRGWSRWRSSRYRSSSPWWRWQRVIGGVTQGMLRRSSDRIYRCWTWNSIFESFRRISVKLAARVESLIIAEARDRLSEVSHTVSVRCHGQFQSGSTDRLNQVSHTVSVRCHRPVPSGATDRFSQVPRTGSVRSHRPVQSGGLVRFICQCLFTQRPPQEKWPTRETTK